ncbi:MFS general substrate transporter [Mycena venus]|uniref:MFS general substrate transporter n=1 Tax=Mycena venus TaxID=2733690 RepID=A0A8H6XA40_9AGAR|nr:MFS general substrate transporter [Mycena venus]
MGSSIYSVDKEHQVSVDVAKELAIETVNATEKYTQEDFDRVRRKQDRILMPLMWIAYGIQQVDKTGLSTQATFGIITDTHMKGNDYAWLSTIFFIFFLLGEFPGNWIMQRFSVGKTLATTMFCWGTIVFCTGQGVGQHSSVISGLAESIANPAFLIITGLSYRTEEHSLRVLIWGEPKNSIRSQGRQWKTVGNELVAGYGFNIVVNLINYGIGRAAQAEPGGLAAWKGMSLFLGGPKTLSVLCFFLLGTPREVFWLSPEEKKIQAARVAHNNTGSDAQKRAEWKWSQVSEALVDPQFALPPSSSQFYRLVLSTGFISSSLSPFQMLFRPGGINTFGNLIYVGLGFTPLDTLVKGTLPQNVLGVCWFILAGYVLSKFKHMRFYWIMLSIIPAFVGMLVLSLVPTTKHNLWPKWGAFFITTTGQICGALVWSMLSTNVAGRTKKSVISIVIFIAYCFGNAVGAQVFQAKWAPRYRPSTIVLSVMFALEFILMAVWRVYYVTINRRRAAKLDARGVSHEERIRLGSLKGETDITDLHNEYFVYDY